MPIPGLFQKLVGRAFDTAPLGRFQVMSDLHLEIGQYYSSFEIPVSAPQLILAGDIGRLHDHDNFCRFLTIQCSNFEHVYLVLGNHEFYSSSRPEALSFLKELQTRTELQNLSVLDRLRVDVSDNVTLLGCSLWSHIPADSESEVNARVSDFKQIHGWTVDKQNEEHQRDATWLRDQVESIHTSQPHRRILIVTHHAPTCRYTNRPEHKHSPLNPAFCTEILQSAVRDWKGMHQVRCWIFGHTHWSVDFRFRRIHVIANQRGYVFPNALSRAPVPTSLFSRLNKPKELMFDVKKCVEI